MRTLCEWLKKTLAVRVQLRTSSVDQEICWTVIAGSVACCMVTLPKSKIAFPLSENVRVGADKLGGGSCPNRVPTAVSSTLSHYLAPVSSHAGVRNQLRIFRLRVSHKIDSNVIL